MSSFRMIDGQFEQELVAMGLAKEQIDALCGMLYQYTDSVAECSTAYESLASVLRTVMDEDNEYEDVIEKCEAQDVTAD